MRFNYGDKARDRITGYEGVVTGYISRYGMRPDQYILESMMKEGYAYSQTVDDNRLVPLRDEAKPAGTCECKVNKVHLCDG